MTYIKFNPPHSKCFVITSNAHSVWFDVIRLCDRGESENKYTIIRSVQSQEHQFFWLFFFCWSGLVATSTLSKSTTVNSRTTPSIWLCGVCVCCMHTYLNVSVFVIHISESESITKYMFLMVCPTFGHFIYLFIFFSLYLFTICDTFFSFFCHSQ